MNALLIYPEFPDTFWSFRHALKFIGKKSAFPLLGQGWNGVTSFVCGTTSVVRTCCFASIDNSSNLRFNSAQW